VRRAHGCVEATGLATARILRPGSCVPGPPPGGRERQRAGAIQVKAAVKILQALRRRRSESEPARKQVARESGYGSSGRESSGGELQGRERHERRPRSVEGHGERRDSKGLERAASQPEPSRGARTLRTAPTRVWRSSSHACDRKGAGGGEGALCVVVSAGARTSREADPQGPGTARLLLEGDGPAKGRAGGGEARKTLERT